MLYYYLPPGLFLIVQYFSSFFFLTSYTGHYCECFIKSVFYLNLSTHLPFIYSCFFFHVKRSLGPFSFPVKICISFKSSLCESLLVNNHFFLSSPTILLPQMPLCHLGAEFQVDDNFQHFEEVNSLSVGMKSAVFCCCYEVSCQSYYFFVGSRCLSLISFKMSYLILSPDRYLLMVVMCLVLLPVMEP